MAEPTGSSLVRRSGPITTTLRAPSRSRWSRKRPWATSKRRTVRKSGVMPETVALELLAPACSTALRVIWGTTRFTLGTCSAMASASSSTSVLGKSIPWRRLSLLPGTTNSTLAPRVLSCPSARFCAPFPTPTRVITEALPITMPSIVSSERSRLARRVASAMPTVSRRASLAAMGGSAG